LSLTASHSTFIRQPGLTYKRVMPTEGGSTKSALGNGSLIKTVYDGSVDMVDLEIWMKVGVGEKLIGATRR
jgi:hypothetical protein